MDHTLLAILILIAVALDFDFINGFHDAANSIATVVSTRVLSPGKAVLWARSSISWRLRFRHGGGAGPVGAGMVDLEGRHLRGHLRRPHRAPSSGTSSPGTGGCRPARRHASSAATPARRWPKPASRPVIVSGWTKTIIFIVVAPLVGMSVGWLMMIASLWIFRSASPRRVDGFFRKMQLLSAAGFSLMHGANDAQKTMGSSRARS
jgi:PiT family inorganic phosphate transporter